MDLSERSVAAMIAARGTALVIDPRFQAYRPRRRRSSLRDVCSRLAGKSAC